MSSTSLTPHNSSFVDNAPISKLPHLPDEIDHPNPTNTLPGDLSKEARVCRSAHNRSQAVHRFIGKLFVRALPGVKEVEQYFLHLYRRNCRPNTFRITYNVLVPFLMFLKKVGKDRLEVVTRTDIEAFIEHEQDRGLKITTVKNSLAILKAFFRFLMEKSVVGEKSFPWKMKIKLPETLPRAMAPEDVGRLLSVNGKPRDRAMIMLLLRTGMRIGELLNTTIEDLNLREQKILIFEAEKNRLGRVVYYCDDAKESLETWLEIRGSKPGFLFYGYKGGALSYPAARMAFVKYVKRAGLSHKGYTLHCLRHTYATDLLNALMPIECLEKLLGHKSLDVTRRYAQLSDKTREQQYFKAMAIIERREKDGDDECDRELQTLIEETKLFSSYSEELHEHH